MLQASQLAQSPFSTRELSLCCTQTSETLSSKDMMMPKIGKVWQTLGLVWVYMQSTFTKLLGKCSSAFKFCLWTYMCVCTRLFIKKCTGWDSDCHVSLLGGAGQRPPPPSLRWPHYRDSGREQSGPLFPVCHLPGVRERVLAGGHHHLSCSQPDRPAGDHCAGQRHWGGNEEKKGTFISSLPPAHNRPPFELGVCAQTHKHIQTQGLYVGGI